MAKSAAQRMREYRRRKRLLAGTGDLVLCGAGNAAARKHGAFARAELDAAVAERLADPGMPDYVRLPAFGEAAAVAFRRVEQAARIGRWVAEMPVDEAITPAKAGSSSPADIARLADESALRALTSLGLTPAAAARFGRQLAEAGRPDLALLVAEHPEMLAEGGGDG